MKKIYICHPYRDNPAGNAIRALEIAREVARMGDLPIAPQIYLPQFLDGEERAMECCFTLLKCCDEILVAAGGVTAGMRQEIALARSLGIPIERQP